jgi:alanine racemase
VGYNGTWAAARPSRIATVAVGYADGWHRSLSGRGHALFDGAPVPLVGRISMDLTTYDATDHPGIVPGAWLELIGAGRTADDIAADAGTNGYEVLTSLGRRYARRYIG